MTTSPPRPYALCWVMLQRSEYDTHWHCCFRSLCLPKFRSVGGGAYTLRAGGEGFEGLSHVRRCSHQPLSGKVKLKIAIKENVTVSAAGWSRRLRFKCKRHKADRQFSRALPTEGPDLQPVTE